jgi:DNA-binding MarR family transcriptional regulator
MPKRSDSRAKAAVPTPGDYRALASFRYALRKFLAFSEDAAKSIGLTPQQHQALLAIMGYPESETVTIGALAKRLLLKHHSTVELVDRLTELDLIKRIKDTGDRRRVILRLTKKAEQVLGRLSAVHLDEPAAYPPGLGRAP